MSVNYFPAEFEVLRNTDKCIRCRACERQCANEVHYYDADFDKMLTHDDQCVDCQRCVTICPTGAIKIHKNPNEFRHSLINQYDNLGQYVVILIVSMPIFSKT